MVVACLVSTLGWAYVYQLDDQYRARARVFVDSNRVLAPLLKGIAVQPDVNQRVRLMSRMLLSRPNLERLSRMTDLDINAITDFDRELMLDRLGNQVRLSGVRGNPSLYNVSYTNTDPLLAKRMVQAIITVFIETTIGDERKDSESAQEFLDQQLRLYETRLAKAEKRLSDFKRENSGKMPGESGGYYQRLESARSQERAAKLELLEASNRRDDLQQQLRSVPATLSEGAIGGLSPIDIEIAQQRNELASLLVRYTDRHPKISQLRESISTLESQRSSGTSAANSRVLNVISNPVHEEIRKLLSEATARVAELNVRVSEYARESRELNETVDSIPGVEAELAQLDRDYTIVKEQYETVLGRRESARLSEQVEQNADDVQFRVIDPPFVPSRPTGPDKLLLSAIAFAAAIGAGAGLAYVFSLLKPVFYNASTVANQTGRSVLGSVSKRKTGSEALSRTIDWASYSVLCGLLFGVFGFVMAVHAGLISNDRLDFILRGELGSYVQPVLGYLFSVIEELKALLSGVVGHE